MALMEVNLLSGFTVPSDAIPLSETVKKVEHDHGKLNLYLDSVSSKMQVLYRRQGCHVLCLKVCLALCVVPLSLFELSVSPNDSDMATTYLSPLNRHHYKIDLK